MFICFGIILGIIFGVTLGIIFGVIFGIIFGIIFSIIFRGFGVYLKALSLRSLRCRPQALFFPRF